MTHWTQLHWFLVATIPFALIGIMWLDRLERKTKKARTLEDIPNMRQYQCQRTGLTLGVIDGQGLGDGIPRGQLRLVDASTMPTNPRWFAWVMSETLTHIKIGPIFEYRAEYKKAR